MKTILIGVAFAVALGSVACKSAEKELAEVAKRWSLTIRASQVIPIYPLSEDLQPGDVFVVTTSVQDEADTYTAKGFLALPMNLTRLDGLAYDRFYGPGYWAPTYAGVPHPRAADQAVGAPRAVFPTYDFEVERGSGLKLALPVQGVPVGLGLMQADSASGSVMIKDAYTYGISGEIAYARLAQWARNPGVQGHLARLAETVDDTLYLRVISRVYLTRGVTVSLRNTSASSAALDAGEPKEIELLQTSDQTNAENYRATLGTLNETLNQNLPGGSLRIAQASKSSVTLDETFDRPLVIGYLGFDVPLLANGELGAPIATSERLARRGAEPVKAGRLTADQRQLDFRRALLLEVIYSDPGNQLQPNPAGAVRAVAYAAERLPSEHFGGVLADAKAQLANPTSISPDTAKEIVRKLWNAAATYAEVEAESRTRTVIALLDTGLAKRFRSPTERV